MQIRTSRSGVFILFLVFLFSMLSLVLVLDSQPLNHIAIAGVEVTPAMLIAQCGLVFPMLFGHKYLHTITVLYDGVSGLVDQVLEGV